MYPPQERNLYTTSLLQRTRISCHGGQLHCYRGKVHCHGGQLHCYREKGLFFLFIALRRMQNPIGGCCSRLKIPELARRIFRRLQRPWLARDILHPVQGVFPVFVFPRRTQGRYGTTWRKGFSGFCLSPTDTGATRDDMAQGVYPGFVFPAGTPETGVP